MSGCPCNGEHWASWHRYRGLPMCDSAKARKSQSDTYSDRRRRAKGRPDKNAPAVWRPGTSILVPETDPL